MGSSQLVQHVKRLAARVSARAPMTNLRRERREGEHEDLLSINYRNLIVHFSYVASLEARVEKLHRRIAYAQSRKASVIMHEGLEPQPAVADRKDSLAQIRSAIHEKAARRREAIDVNELVSDFGLMFVEYPLFPCLQINEILGRSTLQLVISRPPLQI
jgi:peptidoglycan/xylan/chitin deacetylase (PgdA/CDA1 family)